MERRIKKFGVFLILALVFFSSEWVLGATPQSEKIIRELEQREKKSIELPKLKKGKIRQGFKYYFLPEHELPIAKAIIYIKGGTIYDPPGKSGLSEIASHLIRSGGTKELSPDEVDEYLDNIASTIEVGTSTEYLAASISCRSEYFEESLNLLLDMLFTPRFDQKRFDLAKKQLKNSVKRRADSPELLASTGFRELLYGRDNPWGAYETQASVDAITIEDVRDYHRRYFRPYHMIIGFAGDLSPRKIIRRLKSYEHYPKFEEIELAEVKGYPRPLPGVHLIDKETTQVVFNVGHQGSVRFNPDKYSLIVMNFILGGSAFKTRLPALIRVERGLAYSVWSNYMFGPEYCPGLFKIFLATKTPRAIEALDLVISEFKRFAKGEDITEEELKKSKDSILERLIFEYDSTFNIIANVVRFNYFGYPDDYVEVYGKKIGEVSLDDVKRVAKKYLHPDRLQIVLVGDGLLLGKPLKDNFKTYYLTVDE